MFVGVKALILVGNNTKLITKENAFDRAMLLLAKSVQDDIAILPFIVGDRLMCVIIAYLTFCLVLPCAPHQSMLIEPLLLFRTI